LKGTKTTREGGREGEREGGDVPELLLQLPDEALLDLVVGLEELEGDEDDDGLGLAHLHFLGRGNVEVLQVCLPLSVVALLEKKGREGREGGVESECQEVGSLEKKGREGRRKGGNY